MSYEPKDFDKMENNLFQTIDIKKVDNMYILKVIFNGEHRPKLYDFIINNEKICCGQILKQTNSFNEITVVALSDDYDLFEMIGKSNCLFVSNSFIQ